MENKPRPICIAPWHTLNIETRGNYTVCCNVDSPELERPVTSMTAEQWAQGPVLTDMRRAFLAGEKPSVCFRCWAEEDAGKFSLRKRLESRFYNKEFDYQENNHHMRKLQIDLGNLCNFRCVSCRPYQSTQIANDYKRIGWIGKNYPKYLENDRARADGFEFGYESYYKDPLALENFKNITEGLVYITILGGEPMIIPDTVTYLSAISDQTAANCTIAFNTNCSTYDQALIDQTARFNKVNINLSIDGIGQTFEYIRRNGDWSIVEKNIEKFYDLYVNNPDRYNINTVTAISSYNIFEVTDILDYISTRYPAIKCMLQGVLSPDIMSPGNIPAGLKQQVLDKLEYFFKNNIKPPYQHFLWLRTEVKGLISLIKHQNFDPILWNNFVDYTNKLDSVRPWPHVLDIRPEFKDHWHD